jgi:hypothetical protein
MRGIGHRKNDSAADNDNGGDNEQGGRGKYLHIKEMTPQAKRRLQ